MSTVKILADDDFRKQGAGHYTVSNEMQRYPAALEMFKTAIADPHPRVRLEAVRGLSFVQTVEALEIALKVLEMPMDYWISTRSNTRCTRSSRWRT
ncbi:MAG: HEAT repeat domain-containing protein [Pirellulaceae bacterium]